MNRLIVKNLGILISILIIFLGCNNDKTDQESETLSDSTLLASSIIDLPTSLKTAQSIQTSTVSGSIKALTRSGDSEGSITGVYQGIPMYVAMASMFKDIVKEIMVSLVKDPFWKSMPLGTEIGISEDDPNGPTKIMVEKPAGEAYEWKISVWFSADPDNPSMIMRFTITNSGAKGRLLWKMSEEDENLANIGITGIIIERKVDVKFDGTVSNKTLEIKFVQNLDNLVTYAESNNYSTLSQDTKDALDLGQPTKVFLSAMYNGSSEEFTIYGTSYHPTWGKEATLKGEDTLFENPLRNMYVFKAMSKESADLKGSKVFLALPLEDTTDVTNIFETDSIAAIYKPLFLEAIRTMLNGLISTYKNSADSSEKLLATTYVNIIRGISPTDTTVDDFTITDKQLEAFVEADTNADNKDLKDMVKEIGYIVNPAFFVDNGTFLGTYNSSKLIYNKYSAGVWTETGPDNADATMVAINAFDLSAIVPYAPSDVKIATITVE